jgi:two-component system heavy metal sensor histidine kinase CusS
LGEAQEMIVEAVTYRTLEKYYGRLLDDDGSTLLETPGFAELALEAQDFPAPIAETESIREVRRVRSATGSPMFLASAWISPGLEKPRLLYLVALDITHLDAWLAQFRVQLISVVIVGTVMSGIFAWLLTRTGLRPLREITAAMQRVGAKGLDERLGRNRWPHELAATAGEFDLMLERLEEAFQRLSRFTADVAHEFRTPLSNLMISSSFLLSREHENEEYRQALAGNLDEFERLKRMVDSLLFLSRADNAEAVLMKAKVDAGLLSEGVVDFFSALAEERGVTLVSGGEGQVCVDEMLLRMALANLVSNALRHTAQGGRVSLKIEEREDGCHIDVSDTGTGIAAHHLPRLFDRFYRVDAARAHVLGEAGVGLGLALVSTIAKLHGGTVSVSSTEHVGTTISLILPPQ